VTTRGLNLKRHLPAGEVTIGAWISFAESAVAEIMAGTGFDWILIDTEHAPFSPEGLQIVLTAFNGRESVPIVRVPWNNPAIIKQALDLGAGGVLVPMVNSVDEARAAVAACRYPPEGIRGFGPRRASDYYRNVTEYVASANDSVIIALQIEHIEAVKSIADIAAVPGIDVLCLGPNDLSGSMGLLGQIEHPSVVAQHRLRTGQSWQCHRRGAEDARVDRAEDLGSHTVVRFRPVRRQSAISWRAGCHATVVRLVSVAMQRPA
jgi:2-keto-3-deoxy-L-rhamnonate aldolase RhmA